jgi:hypothetical protein
LRFCARPARAIIDCAMEQGQWRLTVRNGPHVERVRCETLGAAVDAMEQRMDELAPGARRRSIEVFRRRYDAARQVVVRAEIDGPGGITSRVRGGVDLRGDGSAEAYVGRFKRVLVELHPGETAYDGLRRALRERSLATR